MMRDARFHHAGCLVADLAASIASYQRLWGDDCASPIWEVAEQSVKVCFVRPHPDSAALELIEPAPGTSLHATLGKGTSLYHTAYEVSNFDAALTTVTDAGCRSMRPFNSAAFEERRCCFFFTAERHLIELIEAAPSS